MIRRDALREYSRGSLWFLPAVAAVLAILLGIVLSQVPVGMTSRLAFQGTADDARSLHLVDGGSASRMGRGHKPVFDSLLGGEAEQRKLLAFLEVARNAGH